jgi:hypothetical protein
MKTITPTFLKHTLGSTIVSCALVFLYGVPFSQAAAAAADGVRCPNGYETLFDAGSKTLRCKRSETLFRPAVCDPKFADFPVYRANKGHDSCVRLSDASAPLSALSSELRTKPVVCTLDASDRSHWVIDIDPNAQGRDRCKATNVEWIYPSQQ